MENENKKKKRQEDENSTVDTNKSNEEPMRDEEIKRLMSEYDKDTGNMRDFDGLPRLLIKALCIAFTLYVLAINTLPMFLLPLQQHRASFVGLLVLYTFLLFPANKKHKSLTNYVPWYDFVLAAAGVTAYFYHVFNFRTIIGQMATFTQMDFIMAIIGIVVVFVACHRVMGWPLTIVGAIFLAYAFFGQHIPGQFGHAGFRTERIVTFLFYHTEGIIGTPIGVAGTFIFIFLLFGAFLAQTGIGQFFIDIANALAGKATGGPAKVAVIASALQGTVSGSSVANTVASGTFTIPLMKRLGYRKEFAGGVEAAASTGGQLMPPILGAAAFLMAEITGIPYREIALAALIPAILYFTCIFASVHFEAKRRNLQGLPADEVPKFGPLFRQKGFLFLGVGAIVFFLAMGFTPTRSALNAIGVVIVISMFRQDTRLTPQKFLKALEMAAKNIVSIGVACAMAGVVVGVVLMTGLGTTFGNAMLSLAGGIEHETARVLVVLFFTMIACLILGMGVPTTAKYVIMATVTAPILVQEPIGLPLLVAHMFVFYFGTDADITPPVGLAAYAAAGISGGSPMITCVMATRLAIAAYFIPFMFVFSPQMLFIDATIPEVIKIIIAGLIGIVGVASGLSGYLIGHMRWYERIITVIGGLLMINPGMTTNLIGAVMIAGIILLQKNTKKHEEIIENH